MQLHMGSIATFAERLWYQAKNWRAWWRGLWLGTSTRGRSVSFSGEVAAKVIRCSGRVVDLGTISRRVVTTAGVNFMRDDFNAAAGAADITNFNFHDSGTGAVAEAIGDTTITAAGPARVTGTQSAPAAKQYRTVATISYTATLAITEHGVFSASTAGTLWDRSVFTAINVVTGDSIQFTYTLSISDGG